MVLQALAPSTVSLLKSMSTTAAAEVAHTLRPPLIKDEPDAHSQSEAHSVQVASITDFPELGYIRNIERTIRVSRQADVAAKYRIQPNDVLISIVGSIGRVAIVPPYFKTHAIPSSNILIFRFYDANPRNAILAGMYYKSDIGQRILADLTHGKTIPLISKKAFSKTPFPAVTEDAVQEAVALFDAEVLAEQKCAELMRELAVARSSFLHQQSNPDYEAN